MAHSGPAAKIAVSKREGMELILSVPIGLGASAFVGLGRDVHAGGSDGGRSWRLFTPFHYEENDHGGAEKKIKEWHQPCHQAESRLPRVSRDGRAPIQPARLRE